MRGLNGMRAWMGVAALLLLCAGCLVPFKSTRAEQEEISYSLEKGVLKIAEGTTAMNWSIWAIEGADIKIVELPASLTEIDPYAFWGCDMIEEYRVAPESNDFKTIDGALFSKDGKKLLSFPSVRGGTYTVPMGTLEIELNAFSGNYQLKELILCEGITSVKGVFEQSDYDAATAPTIQRLVLPSTVYEITPYDLGGVWLEEILVSEDNPALYDVDGVLFSKENHHLLAYPLGRRQEHYDVPQGTEGIASGAFRRSDYLESVSLPRSMKVIEKWAFVRCNYLTSVSLPITLTEIEEAAFSDCVHLRYASISPLAAKVQNVFDNCPLVLDTEEHFGVEQTYKSAIHGIVSPENARETVAVRSAPSAASEIRERFPSGTTVTVTGQTGSFYQVVAQEQQKKTGTEGYIAIEDVQICNALYGAFTPSTGKLRDGLQSAVYYGETWVLPANEELKRFLRPDQSVEIVSQTGQWYRIYADDIWGYIPTNQLTVCAKGVDQGKAYGVVVNGDLRDRLHLREKPQKQGQSLGKYFSGTQVEILGEEGDWLHVKVGFQEGYMMKQFVERVRSVEQ